MSIRCGTCRRVLLDSAEEDVFFYAKDENQIHIAVKPERLLLVKRRPATQIHFVPTEGGEDLPRRKKKKVVDIRCGGCDAGVGGIWPFGPGNCEVATFGRDCVEVCGVPPMRKGRGKRAPKFAEVYDTIPEWRGLERRIGEDNFHPSLGGAEAAPTAKASGCVEALIPDVPLVLPEFSSAWMGDINASQSEEIDSMFGWAYGRHPLPPGRNAPRPYQVQAIVEGLLRNLIVVLPTGAGKTLVAAHIILRLKILNPEYMALFIVDRIPLVFQQGRALEQETGLRVCCLCGENSCTVTLRELNEGRYDVLVVTAGCLLNLLGREWLDLARQFCCVVFDECHHASGSHIYCKVMDRLKGGFHAALPRVIGLTASPMPSHTTSAANRRLNELCECFGPNAGVLYPEVPPTSTRVRWHVVRRSRSQDSFARRIIRHLERFANEMNTLLVMHGGSCEWESEQLNLIVLERCKDEELDHFLNPSTVGRLRGHIRSACWKVSTTTAATSEEQSEQIRLQVNFLATAMKTLLAALESSEVMGPSFGEKVVSELQGWLNDQANRTFTASSNCSRTRSIMLQDAIGKLQNDQSYQDSGQSAPVNSGRLTKLMTELSARLNIPDSRILVLVHTREVARQLTKFLQLDVAIERAFRPRALVGHGGYDGMSWFHDQSVALDAFRRGVDLANPPDDFDGCRLLVATSVLEEGLDVANCDLVIRLQGVQSLIGFIQSRGRARKENSQLLVLASDRERHHLEKVRQQEGAMKLVVQQHATFHGIPSTGACRIQDLLSQKYLQQGIFTKTSSESASNFPTTAQASWLAAPPTVAQGGNRQEVVIRLIIPSTDLIDEEQLEHHLTSVFARYEESSLTLSRVFRLSSSGATSQIFPERLCQSYLVGFSLTSNQQISASGAWELFEQACTGWDFQLSSTLQPTWIQRYDGCSGKKKETDVQTYDVLNFSLGVWGGPNIFVMRHEIPGSDIESVSFKRKEGIVINCRRGVSVLVSQAIISHFCLVDCCDGHEATLFVPLSSAPSVIHKRTIDVDKIEIIRLTEFDEPLFPHLRAVSICTVLCLTFPQVEGPGPTLVSRLLKMDKDVLAVPMFETRVSVKNDESSLMRLVDWEVVRCRASINGLVENLPFEDLTDDDSLPLIQDEFAFLVSQPGLTQVIDPHLSQLPTFNTTQSEVRDAHWILLSAFSQRLGCFTDEVRKYLWEFAIQETNKFLAALNPLLGLPDEMSWLLYALQRCFDIPFWADVKEIFDNAYRSMSRLGRDTQSFMECRPVADEVIGIPRKAGDESHKDNGNWFKVYRAVQTPTRIVYYPPVSVKGSRLYRGFGSQRFVTVSFRDEQMQQLHGQEIISSVRHRVQHGLTFAGRKTVFFGGSSSQLRQQQLLFVEIESLPLPREITRRRLHHFREQIIDPTTIASIPSDKCGGGPKFLSRLALFCTTDTPTEIVEDTHTKVLRVDDITIKDSKSEVFGTALTDGVGCIAFSLAERISRDYLKINFVPSALQVRYLGAKGVLLVLPDTHPTLQGRQVILRPSMEKFHMGAVQDNHLCVVDYSRHRPMRMNRQIVTLLTSCGENEEVYHADGRRYAPLEALQENLTKALNEEASIFQEPDEAVDLITRGGTTAIDVAQAIQKLLPHMDILRDRFCVDILRAYYRFAIRSLVSKTSIPLQKGCQLMGVADEFGVLNDGEVFVQIDHDGRKYLLTQDDVAIWRNPCLHPGDMRIVTAVNRPELRQFVNVIVFPAAKPGVRRNMPLECSGGDLDGDLYYILWDRQLIPPRHTEVESLPYHNLSQSTNNNHNAGEATGFGGGYFLRDMMLGTNSSDSIIERFSNEQLSAFISMVFAGDLLGRIANMHLALSDILPLGARDPLACEVAKAQSFAVDFPKTGEPPKVPQKAVRMLELAGRPDFMDKRDKFNYTSTKPLGFLYRRASSFDFNFTSIAEYASMSPNSKLADCHPELDVRIASLARNATNAHRVEAKMLYERYWSTLRGLMISYGLKSDAECMLARTSRWHAMIHDNGKAEEVVTCKVSALFCELRDLFRQRYGNIGEREKWVIACLWYEVAHYDGRARSFSMVLASLVSDYLKTCPAIRSIDSPFGACHERVGKAILHYCETAQHHIIEIQEEKLALCRTLQSALKQSGLSRTAFQIRPFGSVIHGLCEPYSDLDVCVDFPLSTPGNTEQYGGSIHLPVLQALGFTSMADFMKSLSRAEREQQLLSMVVSPALESVCRRKEEIFSAKVPIVRCFIPSSLGCTNPCPEVSDVQQVDVSCCLVGRWKSLWMQEIFLKDPSIYCAFLLLLRWGCQAGLIKKDQAVSSAIESELRPPDLTTTGNENNWSAHSTALFVPGDFHALIFLTLKTETLKSCIPVHETNENTTASPTLALASAARVGKLVLMFFENVQNLASDLEKNCEEYVEFVWPLERFFAPSVAYEQLEPDLQSLLLSRLETSRLMSICPLLEPARHCLLSCADPQQLLELAAGDARIVHFTQKLSLTLSYRIGRALEFQACRLSQLSGCPKVELRPVSAIHSSQLLISAEGPNRSIRCLKKELSNSSKAASAGSWNCRTIARASRYFMENCTDIRVLGSSRADAQVKFCPILAQRIANVEEDAITAFLSRHPLDEHSLCRTVAQFLTTDAFIDESQTSLFSVPLARHWQQALSPEDLALVRALSAQMMRQLELPQTQETAFESANLRAVFGHFVVVNVSRSLPESQKTLSLSELKLAMEKSGRQRKKWDRGDPTFQSKDRSTSGMCHNSGGQPNSGNKHLRTGNLGAAHNRRKKRNCSRKDTTQKPGIATTFLPTFHGKADGLCQKFIQSLIAAGFQPVDRDSFHSHRRASIHNSPGHTITPNVRAGNPVDYAMSIAVSKGYEVRADFLDNHVEIPKTRKISERSLNWMNHTVLGNGKLPDVRIRFRTTVPISERLSELALGNPHGLSPIRWTDNNVPSFCATTAPEVRKRVLYVRHHMAENYFSKQCEHRGFSFSIRANVTRLREFHRNHVDGAHFSMPVQKAEVFLDFDVEMANRIIQNGANREMEKFACCILRESIAVAMEFKKHGIQLMK